ncbi:hypothetical protein AGMMS49991_07720 [Spirochaetia bacterium]|nr:hypothetical protein AGMMS49991_07720 [Spirochaetia bacterium]
MAGLLSEQEYKKAWAVSFTPMVDGKLYLTYPDGDKAIFDVYEFLERNHLTKGFWRELYDPKFFMSVHSESGMPVWSDQIDIAPEILLLHAVPLPGNSHTSSYISLSMARITAENALPGVVVYLNDPVREHPPLHVLAIAKNGKRANFTLDGSILNGSLDKDDEQRVSTFVVHHRNDIIRNEKRLKKGLSVKLIK